MNKIHGIVGMAIGAGVVAGAIAVAVKNTITAEDVKKKYNELLKEIKQYADINIPRSFNDERMAKAANEFTEKAAKVMVEAEDQVHHVIDTVMTDEVKASIDNLKKTGAEVKQKISEEITKLHEEVEKIHSDKTGSEPEPEPEAEAEAEEGKEPNKSENTGAEESNSNAE